MTSAFRLVLTALIVLALGWAVAPRSALPLYDGVGFPDEPYRFVQKPAGAPDTKPPTTAHYEGRVEGGRNATDLVSASAEQAPQVSVYIPAGKLLVPSGAGRVTLSAAPARSLPAPPGAHLWSNVYVVRATPAGAHLSGGSGQATITLRAATSQRPQPHIAYYTGGHWRLLPTFATGRDIYAAQFVALGSYAVIGTSPIDVSMLPGAGGSSGAGSTGLIIGIAALVVVVGLYLLGRHRRARARSAAAEAGTGPDGEPALDSGAAVDGDDALDGGET